MPSPAAAAKLPPPASPAGLFDALCYPFTGSALPALLVLVLLRVVASGLPFLAPILHLLLWLALYKYALEVLAASAGGRREPPEVLSHLDDGIHRRHLWVQLLVLLALAAVLVLLPDWQSLAVLAFGFALPGLIIALTVAQNLPAALNPGNWWIVARRLGAGYAFLVAAWTGLLGVMIYGTLAVGIFPPLLAVLAYYAVCHVLVLALFRWMGLFLHAYGDRLGFEVRAQARPELAREREHRQVSAEVRAARELRDPAARAAALRDAVRRGGDDQVQHEYRAALRAAGDTPALLEHARVRCSELIALGRVREALPLAHEALNDDRGFGLVDAQALLPLLDACEHAGQWQSMLVLAENYRRQFPRRRDSLTVAIRAAVAAADGLGERPRAQALLQAALAEAGEQEPAAELRRLLARLDAGQPLRSSTPGPEAAAR